MRVMKFFGVMILVGMAGVVWAGGGPPPEEMVPNPEYAKWAKHKEGTYVVMKTTSLNRAADGSKVEVTSVQKQKVIKVNEWGVEIEVCMKVGDHEALPTTILISSKIWKRDEAPSTRPAVLVKVVEESKVEVEVSGVKYEAMKQSLEIEPSEEKGVTIWTSGEPNLKKTVTVWTSDGVPGGLLKRIVTYAGGLGPRTEEMTEVGMEEVKREAEVATSQKSSPAKYKPRKW